ncbi:BLOC-1-related complex subunit 6-like [Oppia nitens]|uniref:BLOC-1-related complex subunit 6-like n=1 Tax=Oppia nitens TaxID=1686743 RepID=UPI0023DB0DE5|nr:BLOC-1-related complex subunit 6-like [Oppia nitens]
MSANETIKDTDNESTISPLSANEDQFGNDLITSSYNEISFSDQSDDQTDGEAAEDLEYCDSDQQKSDKKLSSSLSLPQLSSSIIKWTEQTKASYETENLRPNVTYGSDPNETPDYVSYDGDMVSYVTQDLHQKIKHSSSSPSFDDNLSQQTSTGIEFKLLNDLEKQSKHLSNNISSMLRHIYESTHNITSLTVECISTYETSLNKTCDVIDANIKSMYQLMAKCEELNQSMKPITKLTEELKEVKRLLELFEKTVDYRM